MENTATIPKINPANYRKRAFPTKPQKVVDYYNANIETRDNMNRKPENYAGFWHDPIVKSYFDARDRIISDNFSRRRFLMFLKAEAQGKGEPTAQIDAVLSEFTPEDYSFPLEIRGNENIPDEVKDVASRFGGSVQNYKSKDWAQ